MFRSMLAFALLTGLAFPAATVHAQAVDSRQPPAALPEGTFFPPSQPVPPQVAPPSTVPVEYLPHEMGSLTAPEEFVPRLWADPEAVIWKIRKGTISAPLVTTGPANSFGVLGRNGVSVLGQLQSEYGTFVGARLMGGIWFDDAHVCGMEGGFTWLGNQGDTTTFSSNGSTVLARPYKDAATGTEAVRAIALPGSFSGSVTVDNEFSAWGADFIPLEVRLSHSDNHYLYGLVGFKYFSLNERLIVADSVTNLAGGQSFYNGRTIGPGGKVSVTDSFDAANDIYGGQIGARFGFNVNRFFIDSTVRATFAHNHETLVASGGTAVQAAPLFTRGATTPLGLLVGPFNGRKESQAAFVFIPELNLQIGYQLTTRVSIFAGYNFMYFSSVVRPGDQVIRTVNAANAPSSATFGAAVGSKQPIPIFAKDEFVANGVSVGLSLRY